MSIDVAAVHSACAGQRLRETAGIREIETYLGQQVGDPSHREVIGPLLPGGGASGVVRVAGQTVATWGDPDVPEMLFSATKSVVSLVAGVAHDRGLLEPDACVSESVSLPEFRGTRAAQITWRHLLQQTSAWDGELWGKPSAVDAQSHRTAGDGDRTVPGSAWAYNDVRVNLLCLALTAVLAEPVSAVLAEAVMVPIGGSASWAWHGYESSHLDLGNRSVPVVVGGAHWGGGLWMSANDLGLIGELCLRGGEWHGSRLISAEWLSEAWRPCPVNPDYGYLWWLNDRGTVFPDAPATGRCARGNAGRHLLWVDPARDLVIASHWGDEVGDLLRDVSAAVTR